MNGKYQKTCEECGIQFFTDDEKRRFHNRSCSAKANNRARGGTIPMKECLGPCDNKIQVRGKQDYCSANCRHTHLLGQWIDGSWVPQSVEFPEWLRAIIIIGGCSRCGWSEINPFTGKSPVQIDHKNGQSTDHRYSNIQVLCPNCHSLTHNYGALNKGNGRGLRRERRHATLGVNLLAETAHANAVSNVVVA